MAAWHRNATGVTQVAPDDVTYLPRGVRLHRCGVRNEWFLLAPERAIRLDEIGIAVLSELDGARPVRDIVAGLAERYAAPAEIVARDVTTFLSELLRRRMVEVR